MYCRVCIFATKEEDAFSDVSARCTVFIGLHYNPFAPVFFFVFTLLHQRRNADFGLRMTWTETFHPRIQFISMAFMHLRRPTFSYRHDNFFMFYTFIASCQGCYCCGWSNFVWDFRWDRRVWLETIRFW